LESILAVTKEKIAALTERMERLRVKEGEIREKFLIGSGRGGQKLHKTASCVYLKHLPSGIEVKCQSNRSREINRFLARRQLCDLIEENVYDIKIDKQKNIEKRRKQKKRQLRRHRKKRNEIS